MSLDSNWVPNGGHWNRSNESCHSNQYSLTSGVIECPDSTSMTISNVSGPSYISYQWKKSGASTRFEVYLDNNTKPNDTCNSYVFVASGFPIPEKTHKIKFELKFDLTADSNCIAGSKGAGWLCHARIPFLIEPLTKPNVCTPKNLTKINVTIPTTLLPLGTKTINNTTINNNYRLQEVVDDPANSVIIMEDGIYDGPINISHGPKTIKSEHVWGAKIDCHQELYGIVVESTHDIKLENLTLYNISTFGIQMANSSECNIVKNDISSKRHGIYIFNSTYISANFNRLNFGNDAGYDGIKIMESDHTKAQSNIFNTDHCNYFVYLVDSCCNEILDIRNGTVFDNGKKYEIRNNIFYPECVWSCNCWRLPCLPC